MPAPIESATITSENQAARPAAKPAPESNINRNAFQDRSVNTAAEKHEGARKSPKQQEMDLSRPCPVDDDDDLSCDGFYTEPKLDWNVLMPKPDLAFVKHFLEACCGGADDETPLNIADFDNLKPLDITPKFEEEEEYEFPQIYVHCDFPEISYY